MPEEFAKGPHFLSREGEILEKLLTGDLARLSRSDSRAGYVSFWCGFTEYMQIHHWHCRKIRKRIRRDDI
tara:strand:+ start:3402 stop:3611 length:210 start_codon:yes stop_codon:yes gene_type:complete